MHYWTGSKLESTVVNIFEGMSALFAEELNLTILLKSSMSLFSMLLSTRRLLKLQAFI